MSVFKTFKKCIGENNFNEFKKLLEENPNCVFEKELYDQITLLHFAISSKNVQMVQLLLKYGADIYAETRFTKMTCLHYAALHQTVMLKICLQHVDARGVDMFNYADQTPLYLAMYYNKTQSIDMLLNAGACASLVSRIGINSHIFKHLLSKRHRTQSSALVVLGILRFRCKPVVCRDMRNEIGKRIWETRMDEKWATKEGLRDSSLESSKKKNKQ